MLNCQQTSLLVSQSLDRRLTWWERLRVRFHLLICVYCRRFHQQVYWLRSQLKHHIANQALDESVQLSTAARQRFERALDAARRAHFSPDQ